MNTPKRYFGKEIILVLLGVVIGGAFSLFGSYFAHVWDYQNSVDLQQKTIRETSYADLSGLRIILKQVYVTRFEALIYSDYHEYKWSKFGGSSVDYDEAIRWMIRSNDYTDTIYQTWQDVFNCLAQIKVSYELTPEISQLIDYIYNYENPTIKTPVNGEITINNITDLDNWRTTAISELQTYSSYEYEKPLQQLIIELEKQLN